MSKVQGPIFWAILKEGLFFPLNLMTIISLRTVFLLKDEKIIPSPCNDWSVIVDQDN